MLRGLTDGFNKAGIYAFCWSFIGIATDNKKKSQGDLEVQGDIFQFVYVKSSGFCHRFPDEWLRYGVKRLC